MKEDLFINLIKKSLPESSAYIGDDTAYIPEKDLILTQDTLIEDVHFRMSTISPYNLGIKSIAVNLSDIAASGGIPAYILISLSLPEHTDENFVEEYYAGVREITEKYNVLVVGGDLTRSSKITISIAVMGFGNGLIPANRRNAKVDDVVIVTGNFGSSRAGLWLLESGNVKEKISEKFIKAHINPIPRLQEGREILSTCKNPAMMDSSDGLADALYKICLQSNVSMDITFEKIPYDPDLNIIANRANANPLSWILYGGEDYELVATVPESCYQELFKKNIPIKAIGKVIPSSEDHTVYMKTKDKTITINSNSINNEGFSHFS